MGSLTSFHKEEMVAAMMKIFKDDKAIKDYVGVFKKIFTTHDKDKDNCLDEHEWRNYWH